MTVDQFVQELRVYLKQVLAGECLDPGAIELAVDVNSRGVFAMAKVGPKDFSAIKFDGVLDAVKTLVARFGAMRPNDQDHGRPFSAFFQLYNPSFEAKFTPEP